MKADRESVEAPAKLPYVPPSLVVLGTVQDLTRAGVTGQSDGAGFEEIGGSWHARAATVPPPPPPCTERLGRAPGGPVGRAGVRLRGAR